MIGMGIFTTTGFLAGRSGLAQLVLWIWVVGAVCAFLGAMCYSELGINLPSSGGEYVYLTRAFGPTWGFMTGWVSFFAGFSGADRGRGAGVRGLSGPRLRGLRGREAARLSPGRATGPCNSARPQMFACALVLVFTVLNLFGVQRVARVQNVLTGAKVADPGGVHRRWHSESDMGAGIIFRCTRRAPSSTPLAEQFAISLFLIYRGVQRMECRDLCGRGVAPSRRALCPLALAIGTALVAALYLVLNVVFIYAAAAGDD